MRRICFGIQIAKAHLPQIVVQFLAKPVENALSEAQQGGVLRQAIEHQSQMQHNQVETALNHVGDGVVAIKTRQSRLRHDHAIQGGNGIGPRAAAKKGENHRVGSELTEAAARYVNAFADARAK